jgi:hypothetical protein
MNLNTISIFNSSIDNYVEQKKPDTFFESSVDTLVLSCSAFRHNNTFFMDETILESTLMPDDFALALLIEQYYKNKFVINKLKGKRLSKFKEDLQKYLFSERKKVLRDDLPMITSLPKLYHEDLQVLKVTESLNKTCNDLSGIKVKVKLTYVDKVVKKHKSKSICEYWFKDLRNDAYMTEIDSKNFLLSIWEKTITNSDIEVEGKLKFYDSDLQFHRFYDFKVL